MALPQLLQGSPPAAPLRCMFATLWDALPTHTIWAGHMTPSTEKLAVLAGR